MSRLSHSEIHMVHRIGGRRVGSARCWPVTFWGALAMAATALVGSIFGITVG
jgi:hypothetical protein